MDKLKLVDDKINLLDSIIYHHIEITHFLISSLILKQGIDKKEFENKEKLINNTFKEIFKTEEFVFEKLNDIKIISDLIFKILYEDTKSENKQKTLQYFENLQKQLLSTISTVKIKLTKLKNQHDYLTTLPLRSILMEDLKVFEKNKKPFYLGFVDIDYFKKINDNYGYDIGDIALKEVSFAIRDYNNNISAYRYGGEEFVIVFSENNPQEVLEDIYKKVNNIEIEEISEKITISSGLIPFDFEKNIEKNIANSSLVMKKAKDSGRNKFIIQDQ